MVSYIMSKKRKVIWGPIQLAAQIERELPSESKKNWRIISIVGTGEIFPPFTGFDAVLQLRFDDLQVPLHCETKNIDYILFDQQHARQIWDFVNANDKHIFIHCHAGISRSAAVAAALKKVLHGDDSDVWKAAYKDGFLKYEPSPKVYDTLLQNKPL